MSKIPISAIMAAALVAQPMAATAADDRGLELHQPFETQTRQSFGAQASLTIRFGGNEPLADRTQLGIAAGPAITVDRVNGRNLIVGDLASFRMRPSGDLSFALANTEVARWQPLRAQEEETEDDGDDTVETVLTGGAIALGVVGVVVAVGLTTILISCQSDEGCGE